VRWPFKRASRPSESQTASKNAARIVEFCRRELEDLGFAHPTRALPEVKWGVPFGSFGLDPSCLFPFLPRSGGPQTDGLQPEKGFCQIRLFLSRGIEQRTVKAPNIWWAGDSPDVFDRVWKDVLRAIREKALPFFSRFEDAEEVLRTFLEDESTFDGEGVWEFRKKESPIRLLYTGFAAIECGKWDLATSSLRACGEKVMAIPSPIHDSVAAELLHYVDQGLACAQQKRLWSAGSP
jgi:hypothetical protein